VEIPFQITAIALGMIAAFWHINMFAVATSGFCTDQDSHLFPDVTMPVAWTNKGMSNFMQNGITHVIFRISTHVVFTKGNGFSPISALTSAAFGTVKGKNPLTKAMTVHELTCQR
jgi:hypothetical protein